MHSFTVASVLSLGTAALAFPRHSLTTSANPLVFPGNSDISYCKTFPNSLIDVTSVVIQTGKEKVVTISGTTKIEIKDGATTSIDLRLPILGGPGQQYNFCKDLGVTCPVAAGSSFTATYKPNLRTWPGIPETNYGVSVLVAQAGSWLPDLLCLEGTWKTTTKSTTESDEEWPLLHLEEYWEMK